jgi:hypothetical protein
MTRAEYNEFRKRRSDARKYAKRGQKPIEAYIPISYSVEMKQKLVRMYNEELSFYICNIKIPQFAPWIGEAIIMIEYDSMEQYLQLTTPEEQLRFWQQILASG